MNFLLKAATIIDPSSPFHKQTVDLLIKDGIVTEISNTIPVKKGYEERETIANGLNVAAKSGFTDISLNPNTLPITDNSASVGFLIGKAQEHAVNVHPIGALTVKSKGTDLAELYDMQQAGAIAFGDYKKAIENPNFLKIALQYTQNFDGLVISFPQENKIAGNGVMNEEEQSTLLGLKGIPALAEELQIARDLFILEYTGGRLHIPFVSTAKSIALIKEAKSKGLQVSCSVCVHHLALTDNELTYFDSNFKVLPPLRTQKDVDALLEGVKENTIEMITSDHQPIDIEHKKIEFDLAQYGTIGLESAFGVLNHLIGLEQTITLLTRGKETFGISTTPINTGNAANLSLFNPEGDAIFTKKDILSTSKNSAFLNKAIKGKVYGILANKKMELK